MTLNEFLAKAKINTYASLGETGEKRLPDGTREMVFQEGNWKYRDRYFGNKSFIGEEVLWRNNSVLWAMNYYGGLTAKDVSSESIYGFLKKALRQVTYENPFRGPSAFVEGDFNYRNETSGTVEDFSGEEIIIRSGKEVYRLKYHGGLIKN